MRILCRFVAVILPISFGFSADEDPVAKLQEINIFASGGVGIAGTTSDGEKYHDQIFSGETAKRDFEKILSNGTPEAKAYALHAFSILSPDVDYPQLRKNANKDVLISQMVGYTLREVRLGKYSG